MFRISLPSNSSLKYFPHNTASNFKVKTSYMPDLNSNAMYECALTEIIFPNRFRNVRENSNQIMVYRYMNKFGTKNVKEYKIESHYYPTIVSLIKKIKEVVSSEFISIVFDSEKERTQVKVSGGYCIHFGSDIARVLGFPSDNLIKSIDENEVSEVSPYHATVTGGLSMVYVYSDIIKQQVVGETAVPLLRIINWDHSSKEDNTALTFEKLYFIPLKNSQFDTINILLLDDTGKEIVFEYGKVVVVLEFRKIHL